MTRPAHLEAALAFDGFHLVDESMLNEVPQGAIDRVQRDRRELAPKALVKLFRGGMISGPGQLAKNFQALGGRPQAGLTAGFFKQDQLFVLCCALIPS